MKRFLKTAALLIVSLFLIVSGVSSALDRLSRSDSQNEYTLYDERGEVVIAYTGDLSLCKACLKPESVAAPSLFHRS